MQGLAELYREAKAQGLVVLGVNDDDTPEKASSWLKDTGYDWLNIFDGKSRLARAKFKVDAIPTLVLIDRNGKIIEYEVGFGPEAEARTKLALRGEGITVR
jgi:peroxiredoxin